MQCNAITRTLYHTTPHHTYYTISELNSNIESFVPRSFSWTKSTTRVFELVSECIRHKENVLMVGETGGGKTTLCQLIARMTKQQIIVSK